MLFAVSESNNSIRKETYHPADDGCLLPDHHPGTEDSRKAILIIRNLYQNQIQKVISRKTFRKRYTGKHALDCIANHKCTMKLYPLDMLLAVGGSDNLIGQRTYPRAPEEELSTNSSGTS